MATDRIFPHAKYNEIVKSTVAEIEKLGALKGGEYAGDNDRLANFRRNGVQLDLPMETVWATYYNKHHDAVMQYIRDLRNGKSRDRLEPIDGRVDDMLTYLILFKCMLDERREAANPYPPSMTSPFPPFPPGVRANAFVGMTGSLKREPGENISDPDRYPG